MVPPAFGKVGKMERQRVFQQLKQHTADMAHDAVAEDQRLQSTSNEISYTYVRMCDDAMRHESEDVVIQSDNGRDINTW